MPLNEAAGFRRSGLTTKQKKEQLAAIYGLQEIPLDLTHAEIERMRQIVTAHDGNRSNINGIREFDLNKPPVVPYHYQEYPRLMYRGGKTQTAHSADDVMQAEANGWSKHSVAIAEPESLDADALAEAAALDEKLKQKKAR